MSKRFPVSWKYYAITSPLSIAAVVYSHFAERTWAKEWIYKSEDPTLFWFLFTIYVLGSIVATYKLYWGFSTGEKA